MTRDFLTDPGPSEPDAPPAHPGLVAAAGLPPIPPTAQQLEACAIVKDLEYRARDVLRALDNNLVGATYGRRDAALARDALDIWVFRMHRAILDGAQDGGCP